MEPQEVSNDTSEFESVLLPQIAEKPPDQTSWLPSWMQEQYRPTTVYIEPVVEREVFWNSDLFKRALVATTKDGSIGYLIALAAIAETKNDFDVLDQLKDQINGKLSLG